MNFLTHQVIANNNQLPQGPRFKYCYIYEEHHCSCGGNYQGAHPGPDPVVYAGLTEARRRLIEDLIQLPAREADRVRNLAEEAISRSDAEIVRREGHLWSGVIGLRLLELADQIDSA
ncbi:hypothetical protein ACFW2V_13145 [Streptomyces sp. NPDC058947]|uniref:hypothetical protein n=1 Tax=Streptomyces sp. NPDC058947 TaxID=3346675 RepID=UPI0036C5B13D